MAILRSKIACVFYVELAKSMISDNLTIKEHVKIACDKIRKHYKDSEELKHFERIFNDDLKENIKSSGHENRHSGKCHFIVWKLLTIINTVS